MSHHLPSYLQTLRMQWGMSQRDLAVLLGVTSSALCRFESNERKPVAELLVGAEIVFGHRAKEVFPAFYHDIESAVVGRARDEVQNIQTATDPATRLKLRLLTEIIERTSQSALTL